jgi:ribonuclease J
MLNISQVAMKLGVLHYNKENVIDIDSVKKYADNEVCILTTGSQGEQLSALTRMANDNFAKLKLATTDCVVFSSSPIPGNEKSIINVMNKIVHKGVGLVYDKIANIHASGHACRDEISAVLKAVKPEFVLPVHGEYMHLEEYRKFALANGYNERQIIIADLGSQVIMTPNTVRKGGFVKAGAKLIDGNTFGDALSPVMKDRKSLAQNGFVIVVVNISSKLGKLLSDPIIITRGLLYSHEIEYVLRELKTAITVHLKNFDLKTVDATSLKDDLKKFISNTISRKTKRKPLVLCTTIIN